MNPIHTILFLILSADAAILLFDSPIVGLFFFNLIALFLFVLTHLTFENELKKRVESETYNPWKKEILQALGDMEIPQVVGEDAHAALRSLVCATVTAAIMQSIEKQDMESGREGGKSSV